MRRGRPVSDTEAGVRLILAVLVSALAGYILGVSQLIETCGGR